MRKILKGTRMRAIVQRVEKSELYIEGNLFSNIGKGFMVLLGITDTDTDEDMKVLADKILKLRVFEDEKGKMNLSITDVGGELQIVSQFTLYADCKKGNRPSFTAAGGPEMAETMYQYIIEECKKEIAVVEQGEFGADMKVELLNDGPFTIILDSRDIC